MIGPALTAAPRQACLQRSKAWNACLDKLAAGAKDRPCHDRATADDQGGNHEPAPTRFDGHDGGRWRGSADRTAGRCCGQHQDRLALVADRDRSPRRRSPRTRACSSRSRRSTPRAGSSAARSSSSTRDTAGDPTKAVNFAQQLAFSDKVDFVIGPVNSGEVLATMPIVARAGIPNIVIGTIDQLIDPKKYPLAFRVINTNTQWIELGQRLCAEDAQARTRWR